MKKFVFGIIISVFMTSCATYVVTTQNLQSALEKGRPQIGITKVKAADQTGNEIWLNTSIHSGIRITQKDNSRQTFYFVTSYLNDSTIMGSKSAIFNIPITPIKISNIKLIEFDGR